MPAKCSSTSTNLGLDPVITQRDVQFVALHEQPAGRRQFVDVGNFRGLIERDDLVRSREMECLGIFSFSESFLVFDQEDCLDNRVWMPYTRRRCQ